MNKVTTLPYFVLHIDDNMKPWDLERFQVEMAQVSAQRREKANLYQHDADRQQSLMAYRLLQEFVCDKYKVTEPPVFQETPGGKPVLAAYPKTHFNLSHCKDGVACAISNYPVGVDIESIPAQLDEELAAYVLSPAELQLVKESAEPTVEFTCLWTKKEAYLKWKGTGIPGKEELQTLLESPLPVSFHCVKCVEENYICHVAYVSKKD